LKPQPVAGGSLVPDPIPTAAIAGGAAGLLALAIKYGLPILRFVWRCGSGPYRVAVIEQRLTKVEAVAEAHAAMDVKDHAEVIQTIAEGQKASAAAHADLKGAVVAVDAHLAGLEKGLELAGNIRHAPQEPPKAP